MKSSKKILGVISASRAERMLAEWANTDLEGTQAFNVWDRLFRRYPEILGSAADQIIPVSTRNRHEFERHIGMANKVGEHLRRAWDAAPDLRRFEWHTWKALKIALMQDAWIANSKALNIPSEQSEHLIGPYDKRAGYMAPLFTSLFDPDEPPTAITPVEAAFFYLRHHPKAALHCPNPECPAPYFFRSKKGQKFCSPECAKPAQREAKRKWWNEHRAKKEE